MAQDKKPPQNSNDTLMNEAVTQPSDRSKRINSLHRSIDDISKEENRKRLNISTEIDALNKQQQRVSKQLNLQSGDENAQALNEVTKGLGQTIQNLAVGVKNITVETTKATTQAINQYGKAISDDISVNKTNTIAMSLAQATPIYGYFAAKFMETDVFKSATSKIRENIGSAVSSGLKSIGSKVGIGKKKTAQYSSIDEAKIPKMAQGGYVEKGGVVQVHAGEIVAPLEKITQNQATQQKDLVSLFMKNLEEVNRDQPWQEQLNTNVKDLRAALIGSQDKMKIALQKTLTEHPVFSKLVLANEVFQTALVKPVRWLFAVRGGYGGEARKATRSTNAFERILQILILQYTRGMPKLDAISYYNKVSAETLSGKKLKAPKQATTTNFKKIKGWFGTKKKKDEDEEKGPGMVLSHIAGDPETLKRMKEAGITKISDLLPWNFAKKIGATKGNLKARAEENLPKFLAKRFATPGSGPTDLAKRNQETIDATQSDAENMADDISALRKVNEQSEESTKETRKDEKKHRKKQTSWQKGFTKSLKKLGGGIWKWILIGWSFVSTAISTAWSSVGSFFSLFAGGMASPVVTGLVGLLGSAAFWGVIGAGLVGVGIGTLVNKYLIRPIIDWWNNKEKYKTDQSQKTVDDARSKGLKTVLDKKASKDKKYEASRKLALSDDLRQGQQKAGYKQKQRVGMPKGLPGMMFMPSLNLGEDEANAIHSAQNAFMQEKVKLYLPYSSQERRRLRAEWIKKQNGGFRDRNLAESPDEYGRLREANFLEYLQKNGTKMTDAEHKQEREDYKAGKRSTQPKAVKKPAISPKSTISPVPGTKGGGGASGSWEEEGGSASGIKGHHFKGKLVGTYDETDPSNEGYIFGGAYWRDPKTGEIHTATARHKPRTSSSNSWIHARRIAKLKARTKLAKQLGMTSMSGVHARTWKGGELPPHEEFVVGKWRPGKAHPKTQAEMVGKYKGPTVGSPGGTAPPKPKGEISSGGTAPPKPKGEISRSKSKGIVLAAAYWKDPKTGKAWVGTGKGRPFTSSSQSFSMARRKARLRAMADLSEKTGQNLFSGVRMKYFKGDKANVASIPDAESMFASDVSAGSKADMPGYLKTQTTQQSSKAKMAQTPTGEWKETFKEAQKEYLKEQSNQQQNNQTNVNVANTNNSAVSTSSQNINAGGGGKIQTQGGGFGSGPGMGSSVVQSNIS